MSATDLQRLAQRGLGERRAEGFGEIAIDDPLLLADLQGQRPPPQHRENRRCCPDKSHPEHRAAIPEIDDRQDLGDGFLAQLRTAALRTRIRECARIRAAEGVFRKNTLGWKPGKPSNSQLGSLRQVLSRLQGPADEYVAGVNRWIEHVGKTGRWTDEALDAIERAVDPTAMIVWKQDWLGISSDPDKESTFIGLAPASIDKLKQRLWAEAVRGLFAAAIHAEVRERERPAGTTQPSEWQS